MCVGGSGGGGGGRERREGCGAVCVMVWRREGREERRGRGESESFRGDMPNAGRQTESGFKSDMHLLTFANVSNTESGLIS